MSNPKYQAQYKWAKLHKEKVNEYNRKWKEGNPEKVKESKKNYAIKNKEKLKIYRRQYNLKNKERLNEKRRKNRIKIIKIIKSPLEKRYTAYVCNAKNNNRYFSLTFDNFKELIAGKCYYCGISNKIGIDRKDNQIGYTKENSVSCCWTCNKLKGTLNDKQFLNACMSVVNHLSSDRNC